MRPVRRGFALVLVLIGVAAIFALALQSSLVSRATLLEAKLLHERVEGERAARSAAVLVLKGITSLPGSEPKLLAGESGSSPAGSDTSTLASSQPAAASDDKDKTPELPDILKEILGVKDAEQIDEGAKKAAAQGAAALTDGRGMTGRSGRTARSGLAVLERFGLPRNPVDVTLDGTTWTVRLSDAGGLLNINRITEERFARYLRAKGIDSRTTLRIAAQLIDWRDGDSLPLEFGAELGQYEPRGITPRNGDLFALEEMLYFPDMTPAIFETIKDDLTTAGDGVLHVGSASRAALMSIEGFSEVTVDALISGSEQGTLDEKSLANLLSSYPEATRKLLRLKSSGIVRITVESGALAGAATKPQGSRGASSGPTGSGRRFEGLAIIGEDGLKELGLRAL